MTSPVTTAARPVNTTGGAQAPDETAPRAAREPTKAEVKQAEKLLKSAGFSPGVVDGKMTANTTRALSTFQASMGLPAHGELNHQTLKALKDVHERQGNHKNLVGRGEKSGHIANVEKELRHLGYDTGAVDGIYDKATAHAVREFKADHEHSLPDQHGSYIGEKGAAALKMDMDRMRHAPEHQRAKITDATRALDARTGAAARKPDGISEGAHGAEVRDIQKHMHSAGFPTGKQDGVFDHHLTASVKAFQKASHLPVTGTVDGDTWKSLKGSLRAKNGPMTKGERSSDVLKAEKELKKLGLHPGKVDGLFDAKTQKASRAFEKKHPSSGDNGAIGKGQMKAMEKAVKDQNSSHGANKKLLDFYSKKSGYDKVFNEVVHGWFGTTHNACVAFVTTALKHAGVHFPPNGSSPWGNQRTFTTDMSNYLQKHEHWNKVGNAKNLKPGDVVLTQPENPGESFPAHTYMFQGWANKEHTVANVVDNQGFTHPRNIFAGGGGFHFTPFAYALRAP